MADLQIDIFHLTRRGEDLAGRLPLARMERLADALADTAGEVEWRVRGWQRVHDGVEPEDYFELSFDTVLQAACVRCLEAVEVRIADTRRYRLVDSEEEAERLEPEQDEYDVLAGDARFDLAALIEDELILALPAMPRHDSCEIDLPVQIEERGQVHDLPAGTSSKEGAAGGVVEGPAEEGETRPFATLRQLRRGNSSSD